MALLEPVPSSFERAEPAAAVARQLAELAPKWDAAAADPVEGVALLRREGFLVASVPRALGGWGLGDRGVGAGRTPDLLDLLMAIGCGDLSVGRLYEGHVNALPIVDRFGTPAQRRVAARDALDGRLFGVWNTDLPGGSGRA